MSVVGETEFLERIQFFNGQRLFAQDLNYLDSFHRDLRELHNRSLHQPGIGSGFAVSGEVGDRELTIGPGYAIDSDGHEIILVQERIEALPPVAAEPNGDPVFYDLTVSYADEHNLEESETRQGVCASLGVVRLQEEPVFCWVRLERDLSGKLHAQNDALANDIANDRKIRIARVGILQCALYELSTSERSDAKPSCVPYLACGRATFLDTCVIAIAGVEDQFLTSSRPFIAAPLTSLVQTFAKLGIAEFQEILNRFRGPDFEWFLSNRKVSTGKAGFVTTPCYIFQFDFGDFGPFGDRFGTLFKVTARSVLNALTRIERPAPDSFEIGVFPDRAQFTENGKPIRPTLVDEVVRVLVPQLQIHWIGIE